MSSKSEIEKFQLEEDLIYVGMEPRALEEKMPIPFVVEGKFPDCKICQEIWKLVAGDTPLSRRTWSVELDLSRMKFGIDCTRHKAFVKCIVRNELEGDSSQFIRKISMASNIQGAMTIHFWDQNQIASTRAQYWLVKRLDEPTHPGIAAPLREWIDIERAMSWLTRCKSEHASCRTPLAAWQTKVRPSWLIDVQSNCLVSGEDDVEYLALSYRWGDATGLEFKEGTLAQLREPGALEQPMIRKQLSPVVSRAIRLTALLKYRYIWIDNLCIDKSSKDCSKELSSMGAIYANALLTIVVMDDNNSEALLGLERITGPRPRGARHDGVFFGDQSFMMGDREAQDVFLNDLPYNLRAWTFQEFEMSTRRLVFKKNEVYWVCGRRVWQEHRYDRRDSYVLNRQAIRGILANDSHLLFLDTIIRSYNIRALRYEEDALPGITGLLTILAQSFEGGFLCGIPEACFEVGLCWRPLHRGLTRRVASSRAPEEKLHPSHLPSWSWIGWHGAVTLGSEADVVDPWTSGTIYDTYPVVEWYSCQLGSATEPRRISNIWLANREAYNDPDHPLPRGWTRHSALARSEALPGRRWTEQKKLSRYVSQFRNYVYRHDEMEDRQYPRHWPLQTTERHKTALPSIMPEQLPHIRCITDRVFLSAFRSDVANDAGDGVGWPVSPEEASKIELFNESQHLIGFIIPDLDSCVESFPAHDAPWMAARLVELIAICRRTRHLKAERPPLFEDTAPVTSSEIYAVLWIEWVDDVAYRKGSGEVDRYAWEALERDEINLVLG